MTVEDVIVYLVSRFPHGVTGTRLSKLLFLADAHSLESRGKTVTGLKWEYRWYGPVSPELNDIIEELTMESDALQILRDMGADNIYVTFETLDDNVESRRILDHVYTEYGTLRIDKLAAETYKVMARIFVGMRPGRSGWAEELEHLAEEAVEDTHALRELSGRLYETYSSAFNVIPSSLLFVYTLALAYLAREEPSMIRPLTRRMIDVLEKASIESESGLTPETRKAVKSLYSTLSDYAANLLS